MAPKKNQLAVLETASGGSLIIRSSPTATEVKAFIKEHNRRYSAGEHGGYTDGDPNAGPIEAEQIVSASFYPTEADIGNPKKATKIGWRK